MPLLTVNPHSLSGWLLLSEVGLCVGAWASELGTAVGNRSRATVRRMVFIASCSLTCAAFGCAVLVSAASDSAYVVTAGLVSGAVSCGGRRTSQSAAVKQTCLPCHLL